ncbi:MAG TPA: oxidoreductase, partial [Amnibacterium sp.]|nr:oxidoreductase [Amnibacterium sp.]
MIVVDRIRGTLGRVPMARLVLLCLAGVAGVAVAASIPRWIAYPTAGLVASLVVAVVAARLAASLVGAIARAPVHGTSSLITGLILMLLMYPSTRPLDLLLLVAAAVVAAASKYLVTVGGRHVLNPAAAGVFVVGLTGLSGGVWWVANPVLLPFVAVAGLVVAIRVGAALPALVLVAAGALLETAVSAAQGADPIAALVAALTSTPLVFLAGFMFTEPVTLPPRTGQRMLVAVVVAVLLALPYVLPVRVLTFGPSPEFALLVGNVLALLLARPAAAQLRFVARRPLTASATEYAFRPERPVRHLAGQYLELQLPHRGADRRGIRRTLTIVSPPGDPAVRVAVRTREPMSSFKQALDVLPVGSPVRAVTVSGAFTLPADRGVPLLLVASGIGITPFVSQLAADRAAVAAGAPARDVLLVDRVPTGEDVPYRDVLEASGVRVLVVCPDPETLGPVPDHWHVTQRFDAAALRGV